MIAVYFGGDILSTMLNKLRRKPTSMADFKKEDRLVNLPLYAVEQIAEL